MKHFFSLLLFLLSITQADAVKLELNEIYSGTFKDNKGLTIVLPPGEWELISLDGSKEFYNPDYGWALFAFYPNSGGDVWSSRQAPSHCDNFIVGKVKSSNNNTFEWCVISDGDTLLFLNHTAYQFNQHFAYYYFHKSLMQDYSNDKLKSLGADIYDQVNKNKRGKLDFLARLSNTNFTTSSPDTITSTDDLVNYEAVKITKSNITSLCKAAELTCSSEDISDLNNYIDFSNEKALALSLSGDYFRNPSWGWSYNYEYLSDAKRRAIKECSVNKYSHETCVVILENNYITNFEMLKKINSNSGLITEINGDSIKSKLENLKHLFDEGLISKDQYDRKKADILKNF